MKDAALGAAFVVCAVVMLLAGVVTALIAIAWMLAG